MEFAALTVATIALGLAGYALLDARRAHVRAVAAENAADAFALWFIDTYEIDASDFPTELELVEGADLFGLTET